MVAGWQVVWQAALALPPWLLLLLLLLADLCGGLCLERQRMHSSINLRLQQLVHHAVTLHRALPLKRRAHHIHPAGRCAAERRAGQSGDGRFVAGW